MITSKQILLLLIFLQLIPQQWINFTFMDFEVTLVYLLTCKGVERRDDDDIEYLTFAFLDHSYLTL